MRSINVSVLTVYFLSKTFQHDQLEFFSEAEEKRDGSARFLSPALNSKPPSVKGLTTTGKKKKRYKPIQSRYKEPLVKVK